MARAVLAGPPRDAALEQDDYAAALAAMGLVDEQAGEFLSRHRHAGADQADEDVEVWPEHQHPLAIFSAVLTQWRMGPGGPIGLDYGVLDARLARRLRLTEQALDAAFSDLQVMEAAALEWFAEAAKRRT